MEKMKRIDQWTPKSLLDALRSGSEHDKLLLVKKAGILTVEGKLAPMYQSWGTKASRTPEVPESDVKGDLGEE